MVGNTHLCVLYTGDFMNPSVALSDLIHSYESKVSDILNQLKKDHASIYTTSLTESGLSYIQKSLNDIWFTSDCDGRNTNSYISVVKCSRKTILLVEELNQLKENYESLKSELLNKGVDFNRCLSDALKTDSIRSRLQSIGCSRLNVNHLKRRITTIEGTIKRITYSHYSKGRTITKISPEKAEEKIDDLLKKYPTSESLATQKSLIGNHPHSIPLVTVRSISPLIKVNIYYDDKHLTVCTPMPIFIFDPELSAENISFFSKGITRKPRSDSQIEDKVFLSSINVFRKKQKIHLT